MRLEEIKLSVLGAQEVTDYIGSLDEIGNTFLIKSWGLELGGGLSGCGPGVEAKELPAEAQGKDERC